MPGKALLVVDQLRPAGPDPTDAPLISSVDRGLADLGPRAPRDVRADGVPVIDEIVAAGDEHRGVLDAVRAQQEDVVAFAAPRVDARGVQERLRKRRAVERGREAHAARLDVGAERGVRRERLVGEEGVVAVARHRVPRLVAVKES